MSKHKKLKPVRDYLYDKGEMIEQMFSSIPMVEIRNMVPIKLQGMPLHELKAECLVELLEMSNGEILSILDGKKDPSSSDSEAEGVVVISDDDRRIKKERTSHRFQPSTSDQHPFATKRGDSDGSSTEWSMGSKKKSKRKSKEESDLKATKKKRIDLKHPVVQAPVEKGKVVSKKKVESKQPAPSTSKETKTAKEVLKKKRNGAKIPDEPHEEVVILDDISSDENEKVQKTGEKTLLDLLELEMRARAIRSLLKKEEETHALKVLSEYQDEPDDLIPVEIAPPQVDLVSDSDEDIKKEAPDEQPLQIEVKDGSLSMRDADVLDTLLGLENKREAVTVDIDDGSLDTVEITTHTNNVDRNIDSSNAPRVCLETEPSIQGKLVVLEHSVPIEIKKPVGCDDNENPQISMQSENEDLSCHSGAITAAIDKDKIEGSSEFPKGDEQIFPISSSSSQFELKEPLKTTIEEKPVDDDVDGIGDSQSHLEPASDEFHGQFEEDALDYDYDPSISNTLKRSECSDCIVSRKNSPSGQPRPNETVPTVVKSVDTCEDKPKKILDSVVLDTEYDKNVSKDMIDSVDVRTSESCRTSLVDVDDNSPLSFRRRTSRLIEEAEETPQAKEEPPPDDVAKDMIDSVDVRASESCQTSLVDVDDNSPLSFSSRTSRLIEEAEETPQAIEQPTPDDVAKDMIDSVDVCASESCRTSLVVVDDNSQLSFSSRTSRLIEEAEETPQAKEEPPTDDVIKLFHSDKYSEGLACAHHSKEIGNFSEPPPTNQKQLTHEANNGTLRNETPTEECSDRLQVSDKDGGTTSEHASNDNPIRKSPDNFLAFDALESSSCKPNMMSQEHNVEADDSVVFENLNMLDHEVVSIPEDVVTEGDSVDLPVGVSHSRSDSIGIGEEELGLLKDQELQDQPKASSMSEEMIEDRSEIESTLVDNPNGHVTVDLVDRQDGNVSDDPSGGECLKEISPQDELQVELVADEEHLKLASSVNELPVTTSKKPPHLTVSSPLNDANFDDSTQVLRINDSCLDVQDTAFCEEIAIEMPKPSEVLPENEHNFLAKVALDSFDMTNPKTKEVNQELVDDQTKETIDDNSLDSVRPSERIGSYVEESALPISKNGNENQLELQLSSVNSITAFVGCNSLETQKKIQITDGIAVPTPHDADFTSEPIRSLNSECCVLLSTDDENECSEIVQHNTEDLEKSRGSFMNNPPSSQSVPATLQSDSQKVQEESLISHSGSKDHDIIVLSDEHSAFETWKKTKSVANEQQFDREFNSSSLGPTQLSAEGEDKMKKSSSELCKTREGILSEVMEEPTKPCKGTSSRDLSAPLISNNDVAPVTLNTEERAAHTVSSVVILCDQDSREPVRSVIETEDLEGSKGATLVAVVAETETNKSGTNDFSIIEIDDETDGSDGSATDETNGSDGSSTNDTNGSDGSATEETESTSEGNRHSNSSVVHIVSDDDGKLDEIQPEAKLNMVCVEEVDQSTRQPNASHDVSEPPIHNSSLSGEQLDTQAPSNENNVIDISDSENDHDLPTALNPPLGNVCYNQKDEISLENVVAVESKDTCSRVAVQESDPEEGEIRDSDCNVRKSSPTLTAVNSKVRRMPRRRSQKPAISSSTDSQDSTSFHERSKPKRPSLRRRRKQSVQSKTYVMPNKNVLNIENKVANSPNKPSLPAGEMQQVPKLLSDVVTSQDGHNEGDTIVIDGDDEEILQAIIKEMPPEIFELDDSDDAKTNWTARWLESVQVKKVVTTSKILTNARKKMKMKLKVRELPEVEVTPAPVDAPLLIGSVEEYHRLVKEGVITSSSKELEKVDETGAISNENVVQSTSNDKIIDGKHCIESITPKDVPNERIESEKEIAPTPRGINSEMTEDSPTSVLLPPTTSQINDTQSNSIKSLNENINPNHVIGPSTQTVVGRGEICNITNSIQIEPQASASTNTSTIAKNAQPEIAPTPRSVNSEIAEDGNSTTSVLLPPATSQINDPLSNSIKSFYENINPNHAIGPSTQTVVGRGEICNTTTSIQIEPQASASANTSMSGSNVNNITSSTCGSVPQVPQQSGGKELEEGEIDEDECEIVKDVVSPNALAVKASSVALYMETNRFHASGAQTSSVNTRATVSRTNNLQPLVFHSSQPPPSCRPSSSTFTRGNIGPVVDANPVQSNTSYIGVSENSSLNSFLKQPPPSLQIGHATPFVQNSNYSTLSSVVPPSYVVPDVTTTPSIKNSIFQSSQIPGACFSQPPQNPQTTSGMSGILPSTNIPHPQMNVDVNGTLQTYERYYSWAYSQGLTGSLPSSYGYGTPNTNPDASAAYYQQWGEYYRKLMEACQDNAAKASANNMSFPAPPNLVEDRSYSWVFERPNQTPLTGTTDGTSNVAPTNPDPQLSQEPSKDWNYRYGLKGLLTEHFVAPGTVGAAPPEAVPPAPAQLTPNSSNSFRGGRQRPQFFRRGRRRKKKR